MRTRTSPRMRRAIRQVNQLHSNAVPIVAVVLWCVLALSLAVVYLAPESPVATGAFELLLVCIGCVILERVVWIGIPALWWTAHLVWATRSQPRACFLVIALAVTWVALFQIVMPRLYPDDPAFGHLAFGLLSWGVLMVAYQHIVVRPGR